MDQRAPSAVNEPDPATESNRAPRAADCAGSAESGVKGHVGGVQDEVMAHEVRRVLAVELVGVGRLGAHTEKAARVDAVQLVGVGGLAVTSREPLESMPSSLSAFRFTTFVWELTVKGAVATGHVQVERGRAGSRARVGELERFTGERRRRGQRGRLPAAFGLPRMKLPPVAA